MSEILKRIKEDLKLAMAIEVQYRKLGVNSGDDYDIVIAQKTVSRGIISMFPEIGVKPAKATDDDTIKLLKKYIRSEKERLLYSDKHITEPDINGLNPYQLRKLVLKKFQELGDSLTSCKVVIAYGHLPKQATEEEITSWINENLDLSSYKNKMQAMEPIMKQFKGCDGNFVKSILVKL